MSRAPPRAQRSDPLRELEDALVARTLARHALVEVLQWLHGMLPSTEPKEDLEKEAHRRALAVWEAEDRVEALVTKHQRQDPED